MKSALVFVLCCLFSCGKPSNEISEMAIQCMHHSKSIKIEFTPHPMDTNTLESEEVHTVTPPKVIYTPEKKNQND